MTLLSTPLYSNTTLVVFFPTLAYGGCVVLMPKFDAAGYLRLAQDQRVTHTMLVPVQYQRIMARPDFDAHDLSQLPVQVLHQRTVFRRREGRVLKRWPGGLVEFYGMTEGGGTCILEAHLHPTKLHTVGQPAPTSDIRLIDDDGNEVAAGEAGEVVGHSPSMMTGYHKHPDKTREAEWFDADGKRFIRTGDVGRFDAEGFLTLFDRKKDMMISGGFNIYPSDLEAVLVQHPAVPGSLRDRRAVRAVGRDAGRVRRAQAAARSRSMSRPCATGPTSVWARRSDSPRCTSPTSCRAARSARC